MATGVNNGKRVPKPDSSRPYYAKLPGNRIRRVPIPPPEFALSPEEVERETLIHQGMIWRTAWKWRKWNRDVVDLEDIYQEAIRGWLYGCERFDKRRNVRVLTYCLRWAESYIARMVRIELARGFHVPQVHKGGAVRYVRPMSLNDPTGGGRDMSGLFAERPDAYAEETPEFPPDFWGIVNKFLTLNERIIIDLRYRRGMTLHDIAPLMLVTRERIRQIEGKALEKIKRRTNLKPVEHYL